jgi:pyrimidine-nucleoside phosphorylase
VALSDDFREVVARKRDGQELTEDALRSFILAFARGDVGDPLAAAFLMAAYLRGLSPAETAAMTRAMIDSGRVLPLDGVSRPKVDKHSTGGVADGVTLVFAPLAASLGLAVAKLSGRGLGHTGGTLDKLEAIPGFRTALSLDELERQVDRIGCAVAGQTLDLVPADAALYALRDATATVASIPLIAASIMSKKLAVGTDLILLDVKAGSGAFTKTPEAAAELAGACTDLAAAWDRPCRAAVTDMSQPLGTAVGNALDVAEAIRVVRGEGGGRLRDLAVLFAAEALTILAGRATAEAGAEAERALSDGRAADAFARMIEAQGGDARVVEDPGAILPTAPVRRDVLAETTGYLESVDAEAVGRTAMALGAGRAKKGDPVDPAVGLEFFPKVGDPVTAGDVVARVHARDEDGAARAETSLRSAASWTEHPVDPPPLVHRWVGGATP